MIGRGYKMQSTPHLLLLSTSLLLLASLPVQALHSHNEEGSQPQQTCGAPGAPGGDGGLGDCSSVSSMLEKNIMKLREHFLPREDYIYTIITFKNAQHNLKLQEKFGVTVTSLLAHSSVGILFLIIGDEQSQAIARRVLSQTTADNDINTQYQVADIDAELMSTELHAVVEPMQRFFSSNDKAYYADSLFFLSIAIHRLLPGSIHRAIMLDVDLKFLSDIHNLYDLFQQFSSEHIMGIARENQPVYRHTFSHYRSHNPGTRVGDPPPHGITGFNSGVLLLNIEAMKQSKLYNSLLNEETLVSLTTKYKFKGHLGDQDFFTLISMEYEQLFYILPCGWNRQLCQWWNNHGYEDVFDQYYDCREPLHIYHGNCNTPIPDV